MTSLIFEDGAWRMEFIAREGGLDWLLAAIARSARNCRRGPKAPLRFAPIPNAGSSSTQVARMAAVVFHVGLRKPQQGLPPFARRIPCAWGCLTNE